MVRSIVHNQELELLKLNSESSYRKKLFFNFSLTELMKKMEMKLV